MMAGLSDIGFNRPLKLFNTQDRRLSLARSPRIAAAPVDDRVEIEVRGVHTVEGAARSLFDSYIARFGQEVFDEARRGERQQNGRLSKTVQYTSRHIATAHQAVRDRGTMQRPRRWWYPVLRFLQWGLTLFVGVAVTGYTMDAPAWGLAFGASLVTAIVLTAMIEITDHQERRK